MRRGQEERRMVHLRRAQGLGQGREAAKQTLKDNPDLRDELEAKVREAFNIPTPHRTPEEAAALTPAAKPKGKK